jgi:hypothetical protein
MLTSIFETTLRRESGHGDDARTDGSCISPRTSRYYFLQEHSKVQ